MVVDRRDLHAHHRAEPVTWRPPPRLSGKRCNPSRHARARGHGKAVVQAALAHAWATDHFHVMMQSGRADPRVHAFYEGLDFKPGRVIAYVAMRPEGAKP